jgi:hypothetical protein
MGLCSRLPTLGLKSCLGACSGFLQPFFSAKIFSFQVCLKILNRRLTKLLNGHGESRLSRAKIFKDELVERDTKFLAVYVETENANQLFLSEGEDKLGTLAVAIPQPEKMVGSPLSSILLGDRNMMISRVLAELLAQKTKKISLVSVFIKSVSEQEAAPILRKLLENVLKREEDTK